MPAIDERARHELYLAFEELMGSEKADTLMSMLPPVGWADVATKHDIDTVRNELTAEMRHLEERMNLRFDALEHKMSSKIDRAVTGIMRVVVFSVVASLMTMTSILLGAIILIR